MMLIFKMRCEHNVVFEFHRICVVLHITSHHISGDSRDWGASFIVDLYSSLLSFCRFFPLPPSYVNHKLQINGFQGELPNFQGLLVTNCEWHCYQDLAGLGLHLEGTDVGLIWELITYTLSLRAARVLQFYTTRVLETIRFLLLFPLPVVVSSHFRF